MQLGGRSSVKVCRCSIEGMIAEFEVSGGGLWNGKETRHQRSLASWRVSRSNFARVRGNAGAKYKLLVLRVIRR
jgi:hypothetical protein